MASSLGSDARKSPAGDIVVPASALVEWIESRRRRIADEVQEIANSPATFGKEWPKLAPLVSGLHTMGETRPSMPVRLQRAPSPLQIEGVGERTSDVLALAAELVGIPSVTNCAEERLDEVLACARFVADELTAGGLDVRFFGGERYPAVLATFPNQNPATVTLCGHFDVVQPEPDDSQFEPRVQGDYLWGRGAADMKTVVASYMVWMRDAMRAGPPYPPFNLLLIGNEENGESEPFGTAHVLAELKREQGWRPELLVVGERTGEQGDEVLGSVCTESRGIIRIRIRAHGRRGHTGTGTSPGDLLDRLIEVRGILGATFNRHLTLSSFDGWETSARFPFLTVGEPGVYNITAGEGELGVEVRPIPGDDIRGLVAEIENLGRELGLEVVVEVNEAGVSCPQDNRHLSRLVDAVEAVSGIPAVMGRKKPGSSARFAPGGNQVVWGQTGIGPHSREERHFIPSIEPYLRVLDEFARKFR